MKAILYLLPVLAFAPGIFWLWYFYKKDKLEPEPLHLVRNAFFWGMFLIIPAVLIEIPFQGFMNFLTPVVVAPVVEELLKYSVVRRHFYTHHEFDEPMDGIVYASAVALGFASLENFVYLYDAYHKGTAILATTTVIRAVLSVPGHALFSSMFGYALGVAKFAKTKDTSWFVTAGVLMAIGFHALFNFLLLLGPIWPLGMLILVPLMWRAVHRRIKAALFVSPHANGMVVSTDSDPARPGD